MKTRPLTRTGNVRFEMTMTLAQSSTAAEIQALTGETALAALVRRLLKQEAKRLHLTWPDDMPTRADAMAKARETRWTKEGSS